MKAEDLWQRSGDATGRKGLRVCIATGLLLLFFFLAIDSLIGDSPTMDEQNHIARGLAFLRTGDPRQSLEHPPLINSLSALPLLTMPELRLPTDHPSWERREGWYEFADLFMWQYNHDVTRIVFLARLPIVFLTLALALVAERFGRKLWGYPAGLVAMGLFLFEPNLLAHGRYSTTDMGGILFTFLATYLLWRLWQTREGWAWRRWTVAALSVGLAFGSKTSALGFAFVWGILAVLPVYADDGQNRRRAALRRLTQLVLAGIVSLPILWVIYGFQWGPFQFVTSRLEGLDRWSGPMPTFWAGLEQIAQLNVRGRSAAFLLGRFSDEGFLAYFPVAFLVKTPLVILVLLVLATVLLLRNAHTRQQAVFLLVAAGSFFGLTMSSALNIGYRHALPALPYLLLLISGLTSARLTARVRDITPTHLATAGVVILMSTTLRIHPHYLSYFNVLAGGPANGYRVLTDSNVDWGQDLLRLQDWMAERGIDSVRLGWFGTADPDYYGIAHVPLPGFGRARYFNLWWAVPFNPEHPEPGVYAISASSLWELPLRVEEKRVYAWFRAREPDDRVGYSILIYYVQ